MLWTKVSLALEGLRPDVAWPLEEIEDTPWYILDNKKQKF